LQLERKLVTKLVLLVMLTTAWPAMAALVDTYGIGGKATALGGAFTAYADDVSAIHYNPAGLSQVEGGWVLFGTSLITPTLDVEVTDTVGADTTSVGTSSTDSTMLVVPVLGFAYQPSGSDFSFGFGAYVPYGLHVKWNKKKSVTRYSAYESWIDRLAYGPGFAYKFNDKFSIGLSLLLGRAEMGEYKYFRTYLDIPELGLQGYYDLADFQIEGDDTFNWSVNLGALFKLNDSLSIGATYRSEADAEFEGDLKVEYTSLAQSLGMGAIPASQKTKYTMDDFTWPQQFQTGILFSGMENLNVTFDVTWTNWSAIDTTTPVLDEIFYLYLLQGLQVKELEVNRKWNDTVQVRLGVEYLLGESYTVRGGYYWDPTPIDDEYFDVAWADADKHVFSLGGGAKFGSLALDLTYQYAYIPDDRVIDPGESENLYLAYPTHRLVGKSSSNVQNIALTVGYAF
jgi:long-chain fatty acid transport protein